MAWLSMPGCGATIKRTKNRECLAIAAHLTAPQAFSPPFVLRLITSTII